MKTLIRLGLVLLGLSVWHLAVSTGYVSRALLPLPLELVVAIPKCLIDPVLRESVMATISKLLIVAAISLPAGILVGILVYGVAVLRPLLGGGLDFLRSIPIVALVPIFVIFFGIGSLSVAAAGSFAATPLVALAVSSGLARTNQTRQGVVTLARVAPSRRLLLVALPELLPYLFVGMRAALSAGLVGVVVMEMMIGAGAGMGEEIQRLRYTDDIPSLYAFILILGFVGYGLNALLSWAEHKTVHWNAGA